MHSEVADETNVGLANSGKSGAQMFNFGVGISFSCLRWTFDSPDAGT